MLNRLKSSFLSKTEIKVQTKNLLTIRNYFYVSNGGGSITEVGGGVLKFILPESNSEVVEEDKFVKLTKMK